MKEFDIVKTRDGRIGYVIAKTHPTRCGRHYFDTVIVRFSSNRFNKSYREPNYIVHLKKIGEVKRLK